MMICKKCGFDLALGHRAEDPQITIVRRFLNRGREQVFFRCSCGGMSTFFNTKEQMFFHVHETDDRRCQDCYGHGCSSCSKECEVDLCQTPFDCVEQHHTFPVAIYGEKEANRWPIVSLCRSHHLFWHKHLYSNKSITENWIPEPNEYRLT